MSYENIIVMLFNFDFLFLILFFLSFFSFFFSIHTFFLSFFLLFFHLHTRLPTPINIFTLYLTFCFSSSWSPNSRRTRKYLHFSLSLSFSFSFSYTHTHTNFSHSISHKQILSHIHIDCCYVAFNLVKGIDQVLVLIGPCFADLGPICWKLKTENGKYCNKIIFKYVNSAARPIFNIFFLNKVDVGPVNSVWIVREQCCYSAWIVLQLLMSYASRNIRIGFLYSLVFCIEL